MVAFVREIDNDARQDPANRGVIVLTEAEMHAMVWTFDWRKQNHAVNAMLHYIAHIEQNVDAVNRLLSFISEIDSSHESTVYFRA